jgi:uncharacterized protein YbjT (DUF2867 family)
MYTQINNPNLKYNYLNIIKKDEASPQTLPPKNVDQKVSEPASKCLFIMGGTANVAPIITKEAISKGWKIVSLARNISRLPPENKDYKAVQLKDEDFTNPEKYYVILLRFGKDFEHVGMINTIGSADHTLEKTLVQINYEPLKAAMEAFEKFQKEFPTKKCNFVNISSIAGLILNSDHAYGGVKKKADEMLFNSEVISVSLCPGLVFTEMANNKIDMGHPYSPEQFATFAFQPVLGSGNQIMQPVFAGDLINAAVNALEANESEIVAAVGPKKVSQFEMTNLFSKLLGTTAHKFSVPFEVAETLAFYFPLGRFQLYTVDMFKQLENEPKEFDQRKFVKYLDNQPKSMEDVYKKNSNEKPIISSPPIGEHVKKSISTCIKNPIALAHTVFVMVKNFPNLIVSTAKSFYTPEESKDEENEMIWIPTKNELKTRIIEINNQLKPQINLQ